MKKLKKINKKTLIKRLDSECMALWSEIIHKPNECALCGKKDVKLDAHHIFSRKSHFAVKHFVQNGVLLCYRCHMVKTHREGCQDLGKWLIERHGQEWYDLLKLQANKIVNDKLEHLEQMKIYLNEILNASNSI